MSKPTITRAQERRDMKRAVTSFQKQDGRNDKRLLKKVLKRSVGRGR